MGNLNLTIDSFRLALEESLGEDNSLCFITSNGIYIGKHVLIDSDLKPEDINDNAENLIPFLYSQANSIELEGSSKEYKDYIDGLNFDETILLKDVRLKTGRISINIPHVVLNVNQVISVQLINNQNIEELLKAY